MSLITKKSGKNKMVNDIAFHDKKAIKMDVAVSPELTIMTMNMRFGLARDGNNGWLYRKSLIKKLLKQYPADIIGFQELNHFQMGFLQRRLKAHGFIGWYNPGVPWWQSNSIFFCTDICCLQKKHYFLSHTPDVQSKLPGSKWPRQCVMGLFQIRDHRVIMANTHFDFEESVQDESARLVLSFLDDFPPKTPVIITGDFNAAPGSAAYQRFQSAGFSEVFANHYKTTFHDFKGHDTGRHIDWILYRGPLTVSDKKIIMDTFDNRFPSDHYPVTARFQLEHP